MTDPKPSDPLSVTNLPQAQRVLGAVRRRRTRIVILSVATLTMIGMLLAQGSINLVPYISPSTSAATIVLYGLSMLNFLATVLVLFVLGRNILKLIQERRQQKLGSKFKTQMVLGSLAISILPVGMLFFFTYSLINRSLDKWFNLPAERLEANVKDIRENMAKREFESLFDAARSIVHHVRVRPAPAESDAEGGKSVIEIADATREILKSESKNQEFTRILILDTDGAAKFSLGEEGFDRLPIWEEARRTVAQSEFFETKFTGIDRQTYLMVGIPIKSGPPTGVKPELEPARIARKNKSATQAGGIFLIRRFPPELAEGFEELVNQAQNRDELSVQNKRLKFTYLYILGFVTLLLVFGTTWIALHIARSVTVPIEALAEGTQRVAEGDLDHRVTVAAEDEILVLVNSFNDMAAQLKANREKIEETAVELRRTSAAVEERNRYIETVLQNLLTGVVSLDQDQRVTTINQAGIELLGLEKATFGQPLEHCVPAANRVEFQRILRRTRRIGQSTLQIELHLPNRRTIHVAVSGKAIFGEQKRYQGAVLMIEDLSPLIQAQRSAVWSEVARRMAHEIKNPLTPIQLSAERIQRNVERHGADAARVRKAVEECTSVIGREVQTLQRMVDEFSRFAKLPDPHPEPSSLNDVVSDAVRLYVDRLNGIRLETRLDEGVPVLNLDRDQFKRTLVNLIDNALYALEAVKETSNGAGPGELRIVVTTEFLAEQDVVRLSVADTGHGIAQEDRELLFHPYFSKRKKGTGLGLTIVSHIVADHNGRIFVEDNQPRGARFVIELPAA